jgi:hypothetical protein
VALSGTITSPTEASLTGSADINPPNFGDVKVGEFEASFTLDTDDGLEFSGRGELAGAGLSISGSFTRPGSWSITGTGKVDTGTKRFKVGDIEVITLKVESGSLSLSLSPRGATVRAKGKASVNPLGIATFSWDFDQDVTSDFEIHKTVSFRIAGVGDDLVISYNVFP